MYQLEDSRLAWQRAQAEMQIAMGALEKCVAELAGAEAIKAARAELLKKEQAADLCLQRHITQIGKS